MYSGPNKGSKPCKYGDKCYKNQNGQCTFYHPPQGNGGGQYQKPHNPNPNFYPKPNGNPNHQPGGKPFQQQPHNHHNQQNQMDPIMNQFCRFYQVSECTKGEQCKKKHGFTKNNSLRRVLFTRDMPNNEMANLGSFSNAGKHYLSLRMGLNVLFYEYFSESNKLQQMTVVNWCLPDVKEGYKYYDHKESYIYFAFINENTRFMNIGFYNILTKEVKLIENAHQKDVTGLIHFNDNYLLSSSLDGTIKLWKKEGDNFLLDKGPTESLNSCFDLKNQLKIMFMQLKKFQAENTTILSAGTTDNRLLLWIGQEMNYKQIVFNQQYNKVVRIEFVKHQQEWLAIVVAWGGQDHSRCGVIAVNLNNFQYQVVIHKDIQSPQDLISEIASVGNLLLVSTLSGVVSIYKIPEFNEKVGVIMLQNPLLSNIVTLSSVTSTNIPIKNLIILEKKSHKKQGSFSIFTLTE